NCFVMGIIEDSMDGIFNSLKEGALTMQQGGGVGYDFSTLRPAGSRAKSSGAIASGPVSFMRIWDSTCATVLSTGARRGAMMATLRCDHPDIEEFISAKGDKRELRHFNLSVLITDQFMQAVQANADWPLIFPSEELTENSNASNTHEPIYRAWTGTAEPVPCDVLRVVSARELWDRLIRAAYEYAEPGVLFIDRINHTNPLQYREVISATNPCGEVPLPPYGACNLGSINLTHYVREPFSENAHIDTQSVIDNVPIAVRMLDNVIDISRYPFESQRGQAIGTRRIGLGITGLADTLIMLGLHYGSEEARAQAASIMQLICHEAYRASIELSRDKSPFPFLERNSHLKNSFIQSLPPDIQAGIADTGLRNSHVTAIAPTGTISLLANNISSGIEPVFAFNHTRRILESDGNYSYHEVSDFAWRLWQQGSKPNPLPSYFVAARELIPTAHLKMQAAIQAHVDQAISKTINVSEDFSFPDFRSIYEDAFSLGLKGCTTYRANPVTGEILSTDAAAEDAPHCCNIERECD
ncbi:MAG: adenosylcobalamin-dependent ribonucleoside-diphosphate reductase, partial [Gammaproteobacteria bacterium]|nr:adenosylcobalamin-dependent ribonucleoside-diphosphate reductase [Gammaproteobacteria bacterium]